MKYLAELEIAQLQENETKKNFKKIAKNNKKKVDDFFHAEHTKAFKKIDCLKCANCCKTTSPIFRDVDIKRISKRLRISEQKFINENLYMDSDSDFVLKTSPCLFLENDNTCQIYEDRPLACREYPHTDRKNMFQILDLTLKNSLVCPAVSIIVQKLNSTEKSS